MITQGNQSRARPGARKSPIYWKRPMSRRRPAQPARRSYLSSPATLSFPASSSFPATLSLRAALPHGHVTAGAFGAGPHPGDFVIFQKIRFFDENISGSEWSKRRIIFQLFGHHFLPAKKSSTFQGWGFCVPKGAPRPPLAAGTDPQRLCHFPPQRLCHTTYAPPHGYAPP